MIASSARVPDRARISRVVRDLRKERGWTQAELAQKLGLSQNRLSEVERGDGSFTAEQFLLILQLFNVPVSRFAGESDRSQQLQNALARVGASHLIESDSVVPGDEFADVAVALREALLAGEPRLTTALAPVLVASIDRIALNKLYLDLEWVGRERRLAWVCENTVSALDENLLKELPRGTAQRARRAVVVVDAFLLPVRKRREREPADAEPPDVFDPSIRSPKTLEAVQAEASAISRRWGIVSALQPRDFADALRAAYASNS